jgi:adenylate cyclase
MTMAILSWDDGAGHHELPLRGDTCRCGRSADNDARLADHSVSRRHAIVFRVPQGWCVRDGGSQNGTRVNGSQASDSVLRDGDELQLGDIRILFRDPPADVEPTSARMLAGTGQGTLDDDGSIVLNAELISHGMSTASSGAQLWAPEAAAALAGLVNVAESLLRLTSMEELFERVVHLVFAHVPVENVFLLLHDAKTDTLVPKLARHQSGAEAIGTISTDIALRALRRRESILTLDAQDDPRFGGESIFVQGICSVMCVPLWAGDATVGVVFADSKTRRVRLDEHHLHFLTLLAHVAAAAIEQARLRTRVQEEAALREQLMRYHSPSLVERIVAGQSKGLLEPTEREVTVLFADIVGFSTRSEGMPPRDVARFLNRFFSDMVDIIFDHEGTLDKFIGDAVMAIFGAPADVPDHAARAVQCALAMRRHLLERNAATQLEDEDVHVRIGINTGLVVAGDIGSARRVEYTVVGNTVNIAARLQALVAKPGSIVIGEATQRALGGRFPTVDLGQQVLKGIVQPVRAFDVLL